MEHRLRSPSRTYSDMPETRKVDSPFRPQSSPVPTTSLAETERQRYLLAKNRGVFVPSTRIPASLFRHLESPVSGNEEDADVPEIELSLIDNPMPENSREGSDQTDAATQKVHPFNPYEAPHAGTSSGVSRNSVNAGSKQRLARSNNENIEVIIVEDSDSDSRSSDDSSINPNFFRDSRLPYSPEEDEEIVKFVFSGNNIEKTSSILLWKELELKKGNPRRTYQSLKNRFLRNIKPFILTKYRHLLTPEIILMLKKKFPDLRIIDFPPVIVKKSPGPRPNEKRVVCVNPSMENMPTTCYADRHFGIINLTTERSEPERNEADKSDTLSVGSGPPDQQGKETRDAAAGGEEAMQTKTNNDADGAHEMWVEPGPSTSQLERSVNISAREKLLDVPVQTFKYYENMRAFSNKAAVNLKLILDRDGAQVLPSDLPISVSVTVTIGKEEHLEPKVIVQNPSSNDRDNFRSRKRKLRKRENKKGSEKSSKKGYVLKLKEKYTKRFNNECKWFARAADSLIYKAQIERAMDGLKNEIANISSDNMSDTEGPAARNSSSTDSQITNCSTEDESCYTQTLKKVSELYKVEIKSTQSLIEDEEEENEWMNSDPTPPPIEDKGSVEGDTAIKLEGSSPLDQSPNESGNM